MSEVGKDKCYCGAGVTTCPGTITVTDNRVVCDSCGMGATRHRINKKCFVAICDETGNHIYQCITLRPVGE